MEENEKFHWADQAADDVKKEKNKVNVNLQLENNKIIGKLNYNF